MTTLENLRKARYAKPFKPFRIKLCDGKSFPVRDRDGLAMTPNIVILILPKGGTAMIEMKEIASLEYRASKSGAERRTPKPRGVSAVPRRRRRS